MFPADHAQVSALVRIANDFRLPLVARGAGSGNVGGALPVPGSVVVSFAVCTMTVTVSIAMPVSVIITSTHRN